MDNFNKMDKFTREIVVAIFRQDYYYYYYYYFFLATLKIECLFIVLCLVNYVPQKSRHRS